MNDALAFTVGVLAGAVISGVVFALCATWYMQGFRRGFQRGWDEALDDDIPTNGVESDRSVKVRHD